ncbi:MBL fold metallo-hydrolase [Roseomonas frigidaquae]|uniref:MBL fold metallo-hydrolase n=2 Tax=Falsiroseomonas frigidaquae TaxID=487318 RepID=A0ABX1EW60_9PROT|nr:MBL fold metallo-hydrolase [Falsiroseomonas frigidaquae]
MDRPETGAEVMRQVAGVFHRRVGDIHVTALHDGHQDVAMSTVLGIPAEDAAAMLHAAFRPVPRRTAVNAFLIRHGGRIALIDTGCGPARPTVGFLAANLAAAGIAPSQVDTVLMTHLHPDHFGGLSDGQGKAHFPAAELCLHADEHAYWHDDSAMMRVADPARRQLFFGDARARLAPYRDRTRLFTGGEVFPGVTAVPLPGHTPGHTGFLVASGDASLLIWGDIVHVQELQVPRPEVTMLVDVDPVQAQQTRRRLFDRVAADRQAVAGMHLHFPALAHLSRDGDSYRLVPDAWTLDLHGDAPR